MFILKVRKRMDRISLLPDSLLYHILSFLSTIYVVRTCVLSKRWKTLWTCIPTLNFDYESYFRLFFDEDMYSETIFRMFKNFVIRVLVKHCSTNIQKLSYTSSEDDEGYVLLEFLTCYAGSHNVQQLCINSCNIRFFDWKYCLSTCSSLTELKMVIRFVDNWGVLALPNLKILEIQCDWEKGGKNKGHEGITMFSGCPNLESLVLVDFLFQSGTISTPKLENLELYVSHDLELTFPKVELLTPILKTVNFIHVLPIIVNSDSEFSCIHEVNIQFKNSYFESDDDDDPFILKLRSTFRELLGVFHNATSFTLPLNATQLVPSSNFNASGLCFHNLRHLKLKTNETGYLLGDLLEAPNLETFSVLHKGYEDRFIWPVD